MNSNMRKANLLAENLQGLIDLVNKTYHHHTYFVPNQDVLYRLHALVGEFRFQILADELLRLNKYSWDEKQTVDIIEKLDKKIAIIDEFIRNNYNDLFLFSGRVHSIRSIMDSF
jgi:hypothetical protein